jgi:transcriptional regulator
MFVPKIFENLDRSKVLDLMQKNPFALLVSTDENHLPIATHLPFQIIETADGELLLRGHVSKANAQWRTLSPEKEVLTVFSGAHAYISSSWYEAQNVSTWNYMSVHAYGKPRILSTAELADALRELTAHYEHGRDNARTVETMTDNFFEREMRGAVGFEIQVTRIEAANKLSQNRNERDYANIVHQLEQSPLETERETAKAMQERKK